jgi:hypothetical protein
LYRCKATALSASQPASAGDGAPCRTDTK